MSTRSVLVKLGDLWVRVDAILAIEPNPLPANQPAINVHIGTARVTVRYLASTRRRYCAECWANDRAVSSLPEKVQRFTSANRGAQAVASTLTPERPADRRNV